MSRIHEALKKAEWDKAGREAPIQATEVPAKTPPEFVAPLTVAVSARRLETGRQDHVVLPRRRTPVWD
jgi:hypothetical protein